MPTIRTTNQPEKEIEVDQQEYEYLKLIGFVLDEGPTPPEVQKRKPEGPSRDSGKENQ